MHRFHEDIIAQNPRQPSRGPPDLPAHEETFDTFGTCRQETRAGDRGPIRGLRPSRGDDPRAPALRFGR